MLQSQPEPRRAEQRHRSPSLGAEQTLFLFSTLSELSAEVGVLLPESVASGVLVGQAEHLTLEQCW